MWQVMYTNKKEKAQLLEALDFSDDDLTPANYSQVCERVLVFLNDLVKISSKSIQFVAWTQKITMNSTLDFNINLE